MRVPQPLPPRKQTINQFNKLPEYIESLQEFGYISFIAYSNNYYYTSIHTKCSYTAYFFTPVPPYHNVGCFIDKPSRAIPHSGHNYHYGSPAEKNQSLCIVGSQTRSRHIWCTVRWVLLHGTSRAVTRNRKYGNAEGCLHGLGGLWRNSVYFIGEQGCLLV